MKNRKNKNLHFFFAELRALDIFFLPHSKFLSCPWGELKRFERDVSHYFVKEMQVWGKLECTHGICWLRRPKSK